jgi:hypothetical protein
MGQKSRHKTRCSHKPCSKNNKNSTIKESRSMKSTILPLCTLALVSTLVACTPPDDKQNTVAQPAPAVDAPAAVESPEVAAAAVPALRSLNETERAESLLPTTSCNLESADGQLFAGADITLATPATAKITGWLRADREGVAAEKPTLRVEAADKAQLWEVPILTTIARDDLSPAAKDTPGFEVVFDASALPPGRYHLYLAYRADGGLAGCDNGRYIAIL